MKNTLPILYSFRRCPYAMRARLGLIYAQIRCELREVVLRDKPAQMTALSAKATVPVLHLPDGQVIDESYDIIKWAVARNDPHDWQAFTRQADELVAENDGPFKSALDNYKYTCPSPEQGSGSPRDRGEIFLQKLNQLLETSAFLVAEQQTIADIAIFPFIRQFAHVDKDWFYGQPYPHLHQWLITQLESDIFKAVMKKYLPWQEGHKSVYFPDLHQVTHSPLGAS